MLENGFCTLNILRKESTCDLFNALLFAAAVVAVAINCILCIRRRKRVLRERHKAIERMPMDEQTQTHAHTHTEMQFTSCVLWYLAHLQKWNSELAELVTFMQIYEAVFIIYTERYTA